MAAAILIFIDSKLSKTFGYFRYKNDCVDVQDENLLCAAGVPKSAAHKYSRLDE